MVISFCSVVLASRDPRHVGIVRCLLWAPCGACRQCRPAFTASPRPLISKGIPTGPTPACPRTIHVLSLCTCSPVITVGHNRGGNFDCGDENVKRGGCFTAEPE